MSEIDKITKALLIAYIGDVGCELSNADCNDLTKYIESLRARVEELEIHNATMKKLGEEFIWGEENPEEYQSSLAKAESRATAAEAQVKELIDAINSILPDLPSEGDMLDRASLNDGRASEFDMNCAKLRSLVAKYGGAG